MSCGRCQRVCATLFLYNARRARCVLICHSCEYSITLINQNQLWVSPICTLSSLWGSPSLYPMTRRDSLPAWRVHSDSSWLCSLGACCCSTAGVKADTYICCTTPSSLPTDKLGLHFKDKDGLTCTSLCEHVLLAGVHCVQYIGICTYIYLYITITRCC